MESKNKKKPEDNTHKPISTGHKKTGRPGASGVPSRGGSRQGNIGHQANDQNDNPHR